MLYPVVINYINSNQAVEVITAYSSDTSNNTDNKNAEMIEAARLYNSRISGTAIVDAFSNTEKSVSAEYLNILNVRDNGMMGYLQIPKIDVKIPIYHGTSDEVLQKGVGHVEGSSFPVGGDTTHAVLSAHSGLPSARLFTDLNQLQNGDMFYIYILDQVFAYKVDQVLVVEPSNVEALELQKGEDYVTLVTCTPYAINTHRLLVRGTRVEYSPEVLESTTVKKELGKDEKILYLSLFLVLIILLFVLFIVLRDKKKFAKKRRERNINTNNIVNNFNNEPLNINDNVQSNDIVNNQDLTNDDSGEVITNNLVNNNISFDNSIISSSTNQSVSTDIVNNTFAFTNNTLSNEQNIINNNYGNTFVEAKPNDTNNINSDINQNDDIDIL